MDIVLFTDFGASDIYVGQVKSVLRRFAPQASVIDLTHDVPNFNVRAAAHLLDALKDSFPQPAVFLCVVDPGVGGARDAIVVEADGRRYVGPDNGLMSVVAERASEKRFWNIVWRPLRLSDSFHGRDLFAPIAAQLAAGSLMEAQMSPLSAPGTSFGADDLQEIIYVDHYGNACTGIRTGNARRSATLAVGAHRIRGARVFGDVPVGSPLWYGNSYGLIEVAVNRGSAAQALGVHVGDPVSWLD